MRKNRHAKMRHADVHQARIRQEHSLPEPWQEEIRSQQAKSDIFAKLRTSIQHGFPTGMPAAPTRHYRMSGAGDPGSDAVVAEMAQKLEDYTAVVRLVGVPDIPRAIDELLGDAHTVVVPRGLPQQWSAGAHGTSRVVTVDEPASPLSHDQLNRTDAVVTASRLGIASTGTIVLDGEPDQGRRALSLVPDIHVCVLRAKDIYELVPEAIAVLGENPQRPTTWIAGPSATSDIELVRVNGVHGPRNLRVVIVKDA